MQNLIDGVIRELGQKNFFEAIKYCNQLISQFPRNYIFYEIRGNCYLETGSYVKAIQNYSEAIEYFKLTEGKSNSEVATLYNRRGYARLKLNLYTEAIEDFDKATGYKPDFAEAFNNCGNAYRKLEQYEEALKQCNKAIECKPDFAEAFNNRGNIYYLFSKSDEAILDYSRAIELRPDYTGAYYNRGAAFFYLQKKIIEAKNDWEKVLELNSAYEKELREKLDKIDAKLDEMKNEGLIPTVNEPLSLVKDEEVIKTFEEKTIEEEPEIENSIDKVSEDKTEPKLEIYNITTEDDKEITKQDEKLEDKQEDEITEEPQKIEKPNEEKNETEVSSDIEIPDIDFKNIFREAEKEIENEDDLKPLTEIFEQIYQPPVKKENIIPEEVKQLHKEIENLPEKYEPKENKEEKYEEVVIKHEGKSKSDDIKLPWEPKQKEKSGIVNSGKVNISYLDENEERSFLKSPIFIIALIFISLVIFSVSAYLFYNKLYEKKPQTTKQETTTEAIDTNKSAGNIDSTQIKDTIENKDTKSEIKEETKKQDVKEEKTEPQVTMIKNFVVIKESDGIYLQVASLKDKGSADTKAASINKKKIKTKVVEADLGSKGKYYRVRIGPFKSFEEAKTEANKID